MTFLKVLSYTPLILSIGIIIAGSFKLDHYKKVNAQLIQNNQVLTNNINVLKTQLEICDMYSKYLYSKPVKVNDYVEEEDNNTFILDTSKF